MRTTTDTNADRAIASLADLFSAIIESREEMTFEEFESRAIEAGHAVIARAMGIALEQRDEELCRRLPKRARVHDARRRTLVTEVGDVTFTYHRVRGDDDVTAIPLAETMDLPWNRQLSPGALNFLASLGGHVPYAKAAELLERKGGSRVSAMTVMRALRQVEGEGIDPNLEPASSTTGSAADPSKAPDGYTRSARLRQRAEREEQARLEAETAIMPPWKEGPWMGMRGLYATDMVVDQFKQLRNDYEGRVKEAEENGWDSPRKGVLMGYYEQEQQKIASGTAERGWAAQQYFAELDVELDDETSMLSHRPDYSKTLFAPEHDDIYREFCAYLDQPKPRFFDAIENPIKVEGYSAADVYFAMKSKNDRIVAIDGAAVYNMLVKLRTQPELSKRVLEFRPTCYQNGCGSKDAAFDKGYYN